MASNHGLGILAAMTSAALYGGGDYAGGVATRSENAFRVLVPITFAQMTVFLTIALVRREPIPPPENLGWALFSAVCTTVAMAALLRGLSMGSTAIVAPTAGFLNGAVPTAVAFAFEGLPMRAHLLALGIGLLGTWLVNRAAGGSAAVTRLSLGLGIVAGAGFGSHMISISQMNPHSVFASLTFAKIVSWGALLLVLRFKGLTAVSLSERPLAAFAGLLDAGGTAFYALAQDLTRLDIAAVLCSMYPGATVLLARLISKENISSGQWAGVGLCLGAVALLSL